jgi:transcriptional regulator with XRE-family HTH domain
MNVPVNNRFGVLLAEKRMKEKRNISLAEIADAANVSRKTLYAWQNNKVDRFDVKVIEALCGYFGVPLSALLEYIPPEPKTKTHK